MPGGIAVRDAARADLATVQEIYGHYVSHSVASFEETPPDRAEMGRRFDAITAAGLPYVVAENGGRVPENRDAFMPWNLSEAQKEAWRCPEPFT